MGSKSQKSVLVPIVQALAPCLGRLLCSPRACPSYTLNGYMTYWFMFYNTSFPVKPPAGRADRRPPLLLVSGILIKISVVVAQWLKPVIKRRGTLPPPRVRRLMHKLTANNNPFFLAHSTPLFIIFKYRL